MVTALVVALAAVVAMLGVLVVGLLRSHAEILKALHDLGINLEDGARHAPLRTADVVPPPGARAGPASGRDITGTLPQGGAARVAVVGVDHPTLLAFLSTGCRTCGTFWDQLSAGATALPDPATRVVVVTNGREAESPAAVAAIAPAALVTVMSSEAWDDYGVPVAPYFVLVEGSTGKVVGEGSGTSWEQVVDLLGKAMADVTTAPPSGRSLARMSGRDRADRIDRELLAAGVEPGDPSLYPAPHPSRMMDDDP